MSHPSLPPSPSFQIHQRKRNCIKSLHDIFLLLREEGSGGGRWEKLEADSGFREGGAGLECWSSCAFSPHGGLRGLRGSDETWSGEKSQLWDVWEWLRTEERLGLQGSLTPLNNHTDCLETQILVLASPFFLIYSPHPSCFLLRLSCWGDGYPSPPPPGAVF